MVLVVKNLPAEAGDIRDMSLIPGSGRFPWRRAWQSTSGFLPGKFHGQRSLAGRSPWSCKQSDWTEATYCFHLKVERERENVREGERLVDKDNEGITGSPYH